MKLRKKKNYAAKQKSRIHGRLRLLRPLGHPAFILASAGSGGSQRNTGPLNPLVGRIYADRPRNNPALGTAEKGLP